ncbi:SWF/SNF helicase family protein [bacterium]|nr:SWF/SNF helicase family protein [bacterium]
MKELLKDGFTRIVFCRFIATAEYVATQLRDAFKRAEIEWVTGLLPPEEREQRVADLGSRKADGKQVILVATDCLSEGVNLQEHFDAVIHYDLGWSPTRHEQRDGRVDRFGQPKKLVRSVTLYGLDNRIDAVVLKVLLRKHQTIRSSLGISVPVPFSSNKLLEALIEELLLKGLDEEQLVFEEFMQEATKEFHSEWENASEREKKSRSLFAQDTLKPDEVARELDEVRGTVGTAETVSRFLNTAVQSYGGAIVPKKGVTRYDLRHTPSIVRDAVGMDGFTAKFELPVDEGVLHLTRTHPVIENLAAHVMDTALDPVADSIARRCGVIYTSAVETRTTLLLLRLRYHIITKRKGREDSQLLAEDCRVIGFCGAPDKAKWLDDDQDQIEQLLNAKPSRNIDAAQASGFVQKVIDDFDALRSHLDEYAKRRGDEILDAHRRVRESIKVTGVRYEIEPQLPPDMLGIYVFLPA